MQTALFQGLNIDIEYINKILEKGGVIAFPTETVYGLGAFISNDEAIKKIYSLKNRPYEKALTVHMGSLDQAYLVAKEIPKEFFLLADHFLPGPLTIILKKRNNLSRMVSSLSTVGIRIPSHPVAQHLLRGLKEPIIGTSANVSSQKPLTSAQEVSEIFGGKVESIIDGGTCEVGIPSTVLSLAEEPVILRNGFITQAQIEAVLGRKISSII